MIGCTAQQTQLCPMPNAAYFRTLQRWTFQNYKKCQYVPITFCDHYIGKKYFFKYWLLFLGHVYI